MIIKDDKERIVHVSDDTSLNDLAVFLNNSNLEGYQIFINGSNEDTDFKGELCLSQ